MKLTCVDVFAGIAGVSLAAEAAGFRVAAHVECDEFCRQILLRHWPHTPLFGDVDGVTGAMLVAAAGGRIDLLHLSPPCQALSVAGKRQGENDPRYLWPAARRLVAEARPRSVLVENVDGARVVLDHWLADLEALGYACWPLVVPAAAVEAPHQRYRLFILAYACVLGWQSRTGLRPDEPRGIGRGRSGNDGCPSVAESLGHRLQGVGPNGAAPRPVIRDGAGQSLESGLGRDADGLSAGMDPARIAFPAWPASPGVPQFAHEPPRVVGSGSPYRRQRLQALGNAEVPAQIYPVLRAMHDTLIAAYEIEEMAS